MHSDIWKHWNPEEPAAIAGQPPGCAMKKIATEPEPDPEGTFHDAMRDVVPLARPARVEHRLPRPDPVPRQRMRDERAVLHESLTTYARPDAGVADSALAKEAVHESVKLRAVVGLDAAQFEGKGVQEAW